MQVLIVDDDIQRQSDLMIAFMRSGFQTTATGSRDVAETCIRRGVVDLLVMQERVAHRLTHALALLAEHRNPMVATILMTPRDDEDVEELFDLLPSLHCLLAPESAPDLVAKLALASFTTSAEAERPMVLAPSLRVEPAADEPVFTSGRASGPGGGDLSQVA